MPGPFLNTTRTIRAGAILSGLLDVLGGDPGLTQIGVTVQHQDGTRPVLPQFTPERSQLPVVKVLSPLVTGDWHTESEQKLTMTIPVECFFLGTHYLDHATMMELLVRAVFPALGDATYDAVHADWREANQIQTVRFSRPGYDTVPIGTDQFATKIRSDLEVEYLIES